MLDNAVEFLVIYMIMSESTERNYRSYLDRIK